MSIGSLLHCKPMARPRARLAGIAVASVATTASLFCCPGVSEAAEPASPLSDKDEAKTESVHQHSALATTPHLLRLEEAESIADYWQYAEPRLFAWTKLGLGVANSAQLFLGYGRPNWTWVGLSAGTVVTGEFVSFSGGPQFELLFANAFVRVRHVRTFSRRQPEPARHYERADLRDDARPRSFYTSLSGSLYGYLPAGRFLGMWVFNADYVLGFPDDAALFNEFFRYTMNHERLLMPQLVWWLKLAQDRLMLGPAADVTLTPNRPTLLRAGGSIVWRMGPHLQAQAWLTFPVNSRDSVGWLLPAWGTARIQWNWASEETKPGLL